MEGRRTGRPAGRFAIGIGIGEGAHRGAGCQVPAPRWFGAAGVRVGGGPPRYFGGTFRWSDADARRGVARAWRILIRMRSVLTGPGSVRMRA